jgi:hypothetical protein
MSICRKPTPKIRVFPSPAEAAKAVLGPKAREVVSVVVEKEKGESQRGT